MGASSPRVKFMVAWAALLLAKAVLALHLPLFGDEAFYAWEARHPDWAYSDLPGLTAWLAAAGLALGGQEAFALRLPFLLLGALLPWQVAWLSRRWFGEAAGWQAGGLALVLPLAAWMGVLALPDVPLLVAALGCADACARLLAGGSRGARLQLALALVAGALAHYRFAGVLLAGVAGLLCSAPGRRLLADRRNWPAFALGALAWWPLLHWNLAHGGSGLLFQLVERHPWQWQWRGLAWPLEQALLVTPVLAVALVAAGVAAWRRGNAVAGGRWVALLAAVAVAGYGLAAFFADRERVSFHWPLAGWLVLLALAPPLLQRWSRRARALLWASAVAGTLAVGAWLALVASADGRAWLARGEAYPDTFAGWDEAAAAVAEARDALPAGTPVLADNFMLAAQLGFRGAEVDVLPHPRNDKHGRSAQLRSWGRLDEAGALPRPSLLVVEDTARPLKDRLAGYRDLCARAGTLPPPRVLPVDGGRKRFLLFALPADAADGPCVMPALAWLDAPRPGATVRAGGPVAVTGWALKPNAGVGWIEVRLDGRPWLRLVPDQPRPDVLAYWGLSDDDVAGPVGFRAEAMLPPSLAPGRHWLELHLHTDDGRVEPWPGQALQVEP